MIIHRKKNLKKDYLIIGQGIAGSMIAYELICRGAKIDIINHRPLALAACNLLATVPNESTLACTICA